MLPVRAQPPDAPGQTGPSPRPAFDQVFAQYGAYVLGLVRRLGVSPADAEDVAQEVFVVVHRRLDDFERRSSLKTWVCGICLRTVSNHRRKHARRRERPAASAPEQVMAAEQERTLAARETRAHLQRAIEALPEKQRDVFVLFEVEELSMAEVAQAVGCTDSTAYSRLYAARDAVRARLARDFPGGRHG